MDCGPLRLWSSPVDFPGGFPEWTTSKGGIRCCQQSPDLERRNKVSQDVIVHCVTTLLSCTPCRVGAGELYEQNSIDFRSSLDIPDRLLIIVHPV